MFPNPTIQTIQESLVKVQEKIAGAQADPDNSPTILNEAAQMVRDVLPYFNEVISELPPESQSQLQQIQAYLTQLSEVLPKEPPQQSMQQVQQVQDHLMKMQNQGQSPEQTTSEPQEEKPQEEKPVNSIEPLPQTSVSSMNIAPSQSENDQQLHLEQTLVQINDIKSQISEQLKQVEQLPQQLPQNLQQEFMQILQILQNIPNKMVNDPKKTIDDISSVAQELQTFEQKFSQQVSNISGQVNQLSSMIEVVKNRLV